MSRWNHALCDNCYAVIEPGRQPIRINEPEAQACCGCERMTTSGIYWRGDPSTLLCQGKGKAHED